MMDERHTTQQEALEFANSIVETVREPLLILDNALRVTRANRSFYATFQVSQEETENQRIFELGNGQWNIPALRTLLEEIIPQNSVFNDFEVSHTFPTIGQRIMLLNARKLYRPGNHTETILLAIEDVTQRRHLEEERQQLLTEAQEARAAAEQAIRIRDYFLSIAGHELKNPLTSLLGNLQLIQRRAVSAQNWSERDLRSIQSAIAQARRLHELITTLLDLSRLAQQESTRRDSRVDLCALAHRMVEITEPLLEQHTIACTCVGEPLAILGDELRLEQALTNLINNAVKYSPVGGHIQVTVEQHADEICVGVEDQGMGISEDDQQHLFDLFYRVNNDETIPIEGMGIGLYVVQQIVQHHQGHIVVVSAPEQGSRFMMCFPQLSS